jgi:single-strand DNA-binding protein
MPDNTITLAGNITRDPELKFLNSGQASVRFGIAVNRRYQKNGEWVEQVSFFDVTAYGGLAENVANSLTRGSRVIVTGRLEQRSWETPDGDKRSIIEVNADDIAPSLRYASASVTKNPRPEGAGNGSRSTNNGGGASRPAAPASNPNYGFDEEPF